MNAALFWLVSPPLGSPGGAFTRGAERFMDQMSARLGGTMPGANPYGTQPGWGHPGAANGTQGSGSYQTQSATHTGRNGQQHTYTTGQGTGAQSRSGLGGLFQRISGLFDSMVARFERSIQASMQQGPFPASQFPPPGPATSSPFGTPNVAANMPFGAPTQPGAVPFGAPNVSTGHPFGAPSTSFPFAPPPIPPMNFSQGTGFGGSPLTGAMPMGMPPMGFGMPFGGFAPPMMGSPMGGMGMNPMMMNPMMMMNPAMMGAMFPGMGMDFSSDYDAGNNHHAPYHRHDGGGSGEPMHAGHPEYLCGDPRVCP